MRGKLASEPEIRCKNQLPQLGIASRECLTNLTCTLNPTNHVHPVIRATNLLQEFSLPLIAGVVLGLLAANTNPHLVRNMRSQFNPFGELTHAVLGHDLTVHFIINGMFMCLFFGVAAKEIVGVDTARRGA